MTSDKPDSYLKIGEHIGPLEILEFVGEGQFSRVYRARHRAKARNFILKQFRPNDRLGPLTAEQQDWLLQAFEKEAEITKALRHPNIQACLGRVSNQVGDFLLFPDCMGEPLHRHLAQIHFDGHIPLSRFCDLGAQLLETLAFLRKQRVCHGDIKAENLILSQDGQIKLIDFGAAALASLSGSPVKMMTLSSEGSSRLSNSGGPSHEQDTYQVLELLFYLLTGHKATGENIKQAATGSGANSAPREQILTLICQSLSANWQQVLTNVSDLTACLQRLKTENQAPSLDEAPTNYCQ